MLSQDKLNRLSDLAQKQKQGQLTPSELAEQKALRAEYMQSFRRRAVTELEAIGMRQKPLPGCGCKHKH